MLTPGMPPRAAAARSAAIRTRVLVPGLSVYPYAARRQLGANWAPLRSTRGVARIVAFGGRPLAVSSELVFQLQSRAETHIITTFNPGDKVTILDQGFAGIESIFMSMDGEERVILLINLMNRQQQISLPMASIANR